MNKEQLSDWIATCCKVGTLPIAPGTWGSLAALSVWFLVINYITPLYFILLTSIIFAIGVITSTIVSRDLSSPDPSRVVIDEWVGQWVALFFIPKSIYYGLISFVLFRIFDIWKPLYIKQMEKYSGGFGIMMDDVGAGAAALIFTHVILLLL